MRKLKLQVQMTVDGYMAGLDGALDWMEWQWDDGLKQYVEALTASVDCIVLGRKLAEGFIPYWARVAANPEDPQHQDGKRFTDIPKVVFSSTLQSSVWDNATIAKGDLVDEITSLKKQDGKDIIAYGGAAFVSSLIREGLIDEFHLFINPTAIGDGMAIFKEAGSRQKLKLVKSASFDCGIVLLHYVPNRA